MQNLSIDELEELSWQVKITIESGVDIKPMDFGKSSDPYVEMHFKGQVKKTKVIKKTLKPVWNETFTYEQVHFNDSSPILYVIDWNKIMKHEKICTLVLPIEEVFARNEYTIEEHHKAKINLKFEVSSEAKAMHACFLDAKVPKKPVDGTWVLHILTLTGKKVRLELHMGDVSPTWNDVLGAYQDLEGVPVQHQRYLAPKGRAGLEQGEEEIWAWGVGHNMRMTLTLRM